MVEKWARTRHTLGTPRPSGGPRRHLAVTVIKAAVVLFMAEYSVMCILPLLGLRGAWSGVADALILAIITVPMLWAIGCLPNRWTDVDDENPRTRLEGRLLVLLVSYIGMVVMVIAMFGWVVSELENGSHVINVAGRQRMLSQRLVKTEMCQALALAHGDATRHADNDQETLEELSDRFERVLIGLLHGSDKLDLPPCASRDATRQLEQVEKAWATLRATLQKPTAISDPVRASAHYAKLNEEGERVLGEMEKSVGLLEQHYESRAKLLSTVLGLSITAACLIGVALMVTFRQLTRQRKRQESILAQNEAKIRAIVDSAADGIMTLGEGGVILSFNAAAERIFGYRAEEAVGKPLDMLIPTVAQTDPSEYLRRHIEAAETDFASGDGEVPGQRKDGTVFQADLRVSEIRLGGQSVFTGIFRDITERRRLEEGILAVSQREQQRIGQDLHDVMGQQLAGTAFLAKALQRKLTDQSLSEAVDASRIVTVVNEAIIQARTLAKGLCPVDLEADGLMGALREYAANVETLFDVVCRFQCDEPVLIHDDSIAMHLYRIAQEAVNNAVRHGEAQRIDISMAGSGGRLALTITDNGTGVPEDTHPNKGMGLRIMAYRARMVGGAFDVRRNPQGGTVVTCTFDGNSVVKE